MLRVSRHGFFNFKNEDFGSDHCFENFFVSFVLVMKHFFFQKVFLGEISTHFLQLPKAEQGHSLLCLAVPPSFLALPGRAFSRLL